MVITFNNTPTKTDLLEKVGPTYRDHVQCMWESFNIDNIINGYGFELIRLRYPNVEMIIQKTMFYTKVRLRFTDKPYNFK